MLKTVACCFCENESTTKTFAGLFIVIRTAVFKSIVRKVKKLFPFSLTFP